MPAEFSFELALNLRRGAVTVLSPPRRKRTSGLPTRVTTSTKGGGQRRHWR
jgi:hypothetical protein